MSLEINVSEDGPNAGMPPHTLVPIREVWAKIREANKAIEQAIGAMGEAAFMAFPEWYAPTGQRQHDREALREALRCEISVLVDHRTYLLKMLDKATP